MPKPLGWERFSRSQKIAWLEEQDALRAGREGTISKLGFEQLGVAMEEGQVSPEIFNQIVGQFRETGRFPSFPQTQNIPGSIRYPGTTKTSFTTEPIRFGKKEELKPVFARDPISGKLTFQEKVPKSAEILTTAKPEKKKEPKEKVSGKRKDQRLERIKLRRQILDTEIDNLQRKITREEKNPNISEDQRIKNLENLDNVFTRKNAELGKLDQQLLELETGEEQGRTQDLSALSVQEIGSLVDSGQLNEKTAEQELSRRGFKRRR